MTGGCGLRCEADGRLRLAAQVHTCSQYIQSVRQLCRRILSLKSAAWQPPSRLWLCRRQRAQS